MLYYSWCPRMPMNSSSKSTSSPYKNKMEGEVVGSRLIMCVITNKYYWCRRTLAMMVFSSSILGVFLWILLYINLETLSWLHPQFVFARPLTWDVVFSLFWSCCYPFHFVFGSYALRWKLQMNWSSPPTQMPGCCQRRLESWRKLSRKETLPYHQPRQSISFWTKIKDHLLPVKISNNHGLIRIKVTEYQIYRMFLCCQGCTKSHNLVKDQEKKKKKIILGAVECESFFNSAESPFSFIQYLYLLFGIN